MYLLQIVRFAIAIFSVRSSPILQHYTPEVTLPHLPQQRFPEIEELVLLKVPLRIGVVGVEVISRFPIYQRENDGQTHLGPIPMR